MKIAIVTVYESMNAGAYLQAWALKEFLTLNNHQVSYLENNSRPLELITFKKFQGAMRKGQFKKAVYVIKNYRAFKKHHKNYQLCRQSFREMHNQDLFILGSDEIWNVTKKDMISYPIFWGVGLPNKPIISYAPSSNNATKKNIEEHDFIPAALNNICAISVRDTHTEKLISALTNKQVTLVSDPTMLFSKEDYEKYTVDIEDKNYILVYDPYGNFTKVEIEECVKFSKKINKKLISFGNYLSWCDKTIVSDPMVYLSYFKNADIIFTGTFHGTIYSMIFNKQFVTLGKIGLKVIHTLEYYGLESRICEEKSLAALAKKRIDYEPVNCKMKEMRANSALFLTNAISAVSCD